MSLVDRIKHFAADVRGATAVTFGLLAIPLAVIVLGVIDYSRLSLVHQQLQETLDASALIAARSTATTDSDIDKVGDAAFVATMAKFNVKTSTSTFKAGAENGIEGTAAATITPIIFGLIAKGDMQANVTTVVKRAQGTPVELVLVLDTTGSMSGQPLIDQKKAASDLVKELHKNSDGKNLKIGVVPFGQYVNIGVSRRNESWVSVPADYDENVPAGACTIQTTQTTCQTQTYACTKYNDGKPYAATCSNQINCVTKVLVPPKTTCPAPKIVKHKFNGCIGSPAYPKNVRDDDPSRVYPGYLDLTCNSEITPLTTNQGAVISAINVLTAKDYTYIPAGLAWGFNMLSAAKPLTEAVAYDKTGANLEPRKALVLMTDGANTVVLNTANGKHDKQASPAKQANDAVEELCKNIKKEKIEVFTVAFQIDDKDAKEMVQKCATDTDHYFDASDGAKLQSSFARIAEALRNLYIAK